jgi:hypothetical protein
VPRSNTKADFNRSPALHAEHLKTNPSCDGTLGLINRGPSEPTRVCRTAATRPT